MPKQKLSSREKQLLDQARRFGIVAFTLGADNWRISYILGTLSPEEREGFLGELRRFINLE